MGSDYGEHLDAASLRLLAETTGFAVPGDTTPAFNSRPNDIKLALASPAAARLLDISQPQATVQQHLLQLAIAVHQTAEDICQAGWIATDESIIDLELISFSGQTEHQHFVVGLLASYLRASVPVDLAHLEPTPHTCDEQRLEQLIALCNEAGPTERAGALRLLGDEALFTAGMFPAAAHQIRVTPDLLRSLEAVLPKAVVMLMGDLKTQLHSVLDVYLMFGPIWYRMATQNLLLNRSRGTLDSIATDFVTARRFIVQVAQGPLAAIKHDLYPGIAQPHRIASAQ